MVERLSTVFGVVVLALVLGAAALFFNPEATVSLGPQTLPLWAMAALFGGAIGWACGAESDWRRETAKVSDRIRVVSPPSGLTPGQRYCVADIEAELSKKLLPSGKAFVQFRYEGSKKRFNWNAVLIFHPVAAPADADATLTDLSSAIASKYQEQNARLIVTIADAFGKAIAPRTLVSTVR